MGTVSPLNGDYFAEWYFAVESTVLMDRQIGWIDRQVDEELHQHQQQRQQQRQRPVNRPHGSKMAHAHSDICVYRQQFGGLVPTMDRIVICGMETHSNPISEGRQNRRSVLDRQHAYQSADGQSAGHRAGQGLCTLSKA